MGQGDGRRDRRGDDRRRDPVPRIPRLVADDITPEAAVSPLAEQGRRLAIISAEGGIFDIIAGRYTWSLANMDVSSRGTRRPAAGGSQRPPPPRICAAARADPGADD